MTIDNWIDISCWQTPFGKRSKSKVLDPLLTDNNNINFDNDEYEESDSDEELVLTNRHHPWFLILEVCQWAVILFLTNMTII